MVSEARMIRPRLHQDRPTTALKPTAISTPATTETTRRIPVVSVAYKVTWTTSSAVSGAVSGAGSVLSHTATAEDGPAAAVAGIVHMTPGSLRYRVGPAAHAGTCGICSVLSPACSVFHVLRGCRGHPARMTIIE